jgi:glycosyltransferase involved in cell wall biosynthesis
MIENLPLSIVEAFAHGVPVICTPVGSVPEIVEDGRTGLIVPAGDSKALARALKRLIQDKGLRNSLASAGLEAFAARFELGGYVRRLAALWKAAAGGPSDKML